jgi:hypothetical protein
MHDGSVKTGDDWLRARLKSYADWAKSNNSLLIVQWDEDAGGSANHIPTIFYGARVKPGKYTRRLDHYQLLATLESSDNLPLLNKANTPINDAWTSTTTDAHRERDRVPVDVRHDREPHAARQHELRFRRAWLTASAWGSPARPPARSSSSAARPASRRLRGPSPTTCSAPTTTGLSIGQVWAKGSYTLTVQLFSGTGATGTLLTTRTIRFTIA